MDRADILTLRRHLLAAEPASLAGPVDGDWLDNLKFFAASFLGGLVFFSTLVG